DTDRTDDGLGMLPELVTVLLDAEGGDAMPGGSEEVTAPGASGADDDLALPEDLEAALELLVDEHLADPGGQGRALDPEALRRLVEALGGDALGQARADLLAQAGLYVTQLVGKRLAEAVRDAKAPEVAARDPLRRAPRAGVAESAVFVYDEWDHLI